MKTLCILPWLTVDTLPDGSLAPCCYVPPESRFKGSSQGIEAYKNSSFLTELQSQMLAGEEPSACAGCYKLEKCGSSQSPRLKANRDYLREPLPESFQHLHLRLSNNCDMSCRSCSAFCSTSWNKDRIQINPKLTPLNFDLFSGNKELETDTYRLSSQVEHLYLSGGEPFLESRLPRVLESFLKGENHQERVLGIQTNLTNGHIFANKYATLLKKVPNLYLYLSIDGIESQGEFIREGLSWKNFKDNLFKLKSEFPNATLIYTPTISIYNTIHILKLFKFLEEQKLLENSWIETYMVSSPEALNPTLLPKKLKLKLRETYSNFKTSNKSINTALEEILSYIESEDNSDRFLSFLTYTKLLDRLRGQNTFELFPELKLE